jgi:hypothetical protein
VWGVPLQKRIGIFRSKRGISPVAYSPDHAADVMILNGGLKVERARSEWVLQVLAKRETSFVERKEETLSFNSFGRSVRSSSIGLLLRNIVDLSIENNKFLDKCFVLGEITSKFCCYPL